MAGAAESYFLSLVTAYLTPHLYPILTLTLPSPHHSAPTRMPALEQLPYEIAAKILSYLPASDLLSTSSLSRHMHAISQPLLYRAPYLPYTEEMVPAPLHLFLRTLLSSGGETLATYIRSFRLDYGGDIEEPDTEDDELEPTPDSLGDLALLVAAVTPLGLHQYLESEVGRLLLLLHLVPRLNSLHLRPLHRGNPSVFKFIDGHNDTLSTDALPPGLRQLREFYCLAGYGCGLSPADLLTVLSLPCIRKIHIQVLNASCISVDTARLAAATSTVTNLLFVEADNSQRSLECILKIPIALTHFAYCAKSSHPSFDMAVALQPLRASLTHLHLECEDVLLHIGSLRDWPALRTVRSSLTSLIGKGPQDKSLSLADVLPVGLLKLEILRDPYWPVLGEVGKTVELLGRKETAVPALVTLAVMISPAGMTRDRRYQANLRHACENNGVLLVHIGVRGGRIGLRATMARMGPPTLIR